MVKLHKDDSPVWSDLLILKIKDIYDLNGRASKVNKGDRVSVD
jgi:hypothetical protein